MESSVDPDQLASSEASCPGFTLFSFSKVSIGLEISNVGIELEISKVGIELKISNQKWV